jgi:hypothetical protein
VTTAGNVTIDISGWATSGTGGFGVTTTPQTAAVYKNAQTPSPSASSGGCDAGFGAFTLILPGAAFVLRKRVR